MRISEAQARAYETAKGKGWHDEERSFGDIASLIHTEVSEAVEAYRSEGLEIWYRDDGKPEGVPYELADVVVRVMDWFGSQGLELEEFLQTKMRFNATRSRRHGGKRL